MRKKGWPVLGLVLSGTGAVLLMHGPRTDHGQTSSYADLSPEDHFAAADHPPATAPSIERAAGIVPQQPEDAVANEARASPEPVPQPARDNMVPDPRGRAKPMRKWLPELIELVSYDVKSVAEVSGTLGTITDEATNHSMAWLDPLYPELEEIEVSCIADTLMPQILILRFRPEQRPTLAQLRNFLGDFEEHKRDRKLSPIASFPHASRAGTPWVVSVSATLVDDDASGPQRRVTELWLRRDRR